ncbi:MULTISPECIES: hypothetical protein [Burkholderia]|uniref:hypothetical protein n=1 Tax=Burkholderia TaxID=32008 RepID=UPI00158D0832|nr:hypothetical protein [Burkholderia seminalis]
MEPVNSCTRRPLDDRLRCRLTAVDGRRYWRAGWHILLAGALFALIDVLEGRGIAWRTAAQHGDPVARAGREWVRTFVGHRDALSVLEHAMTGFGAALLGVVALQLYYAQLAVETRRRTVGPLGRAIALLVAGTLGIGMGQVSHTGTQIRIGVFMAGAVWVTFVFRDLWRQLACDAPQWNIGWVGGVVWVFDDVAWKMYHASVTRDPPAIVVAQLAAGLVLLVLTCWAVGWLTRRIRWLHPIPNGGR